MRRVFGWLVLILNFLFMGLIDNVSVSATEYFYDGKGTISHYKEDTEVFTFDYDYTLKFTEDSNFYNGVEIYDGDKSIKKDLVYGANQITVHVTDFDLPLLWNKDDDKVEIYSYSINKQNFSSVKWGCYNQSGSYTITEEGVYKIAYTFEGNEENVKYVYVGSSLHTLTISVDKYADNNVYSYLTAKLTIKDAYDLRQNKYYYAFGVSEENLNFVQFDLFSEDEMNSGDVITSVADRVVNFYIKESDCEDMLAKKLYVKVVKSVSNGEKEKVVKTNKAYNLFDKLNSTVYFLDSEDNPIEENLYAKINDTINVKIVFDFPVVASNLELSFDGKNTIDLATVVDETNFLNFQYKLEEGKVLDSDQSNFFLRNKGDSENKLSVLLKSHSVFVSVSLSVDYYFDLTAPSINVEGDSNEKVQNMFDLILKVEDKNLSLVEYYFDKCTSLQEGKCVEAGMYDGEKKVVESLSGEKLQEMIENNAAEIPVVLGQESDVGKLDGVSMVLFVKSVDGAGNVSYNSFVDYVVDNTIIENFESVLVEEDVVDEDQNVVGKLFKIKTKEDYKIKEVKFKYDGGESYNTCELDGEAYECLKVENYYFSSDMDVLIVDEFGNNEVYKYSFKYNDLEEKSVQVESYMINIYNNKPYDAEISNLTNYLGVTENRLVFSESLMRKIEENINLNSIPNIEELTKKLIFIDEDVVELASSIDGDLEIPSTMSILEKINSAPMFAQCALKGQLCNMTLYIQYSYKLNGVLQKRFVRLNFVDNTIKLEIDNFEQERIIEALSIFELYNYTAYDALGMEINQSTHSVNRTIMFEDKMGEISDVSSVDTNRLGKYTIKEQIVLDEEGSLPLVYTVVVKDTKAPVVVLEGTKEIVLKRGQKLDGVTKGVAVHDEYDKDIKIEYDVSEVNENRVGKYTIRYWAVDSSGNRSNEVSRTVVVEENNTIKTYLIVGGVGLFVVAIIAVCIIIERKKEGRKS